MRTGKLRLREIQLVRITGKTACHAPGLTAHA